MLTITIVFFPGRDIVTRSTVCEMLSPNMSFSLKRHDMEHMNENSRMLDSIKACLMELESNRLPHPMGLPYPLPYPLCRDSFSNVAFFKEGHGRLLYTALFYKHEESFSEGEQSSRVDTHGESAGVPVLVKFSVYTSYSEAIHRALANVSLAPSLFFTEQLKGGMIMIVMELLDPSQGWRPLASLDAQDLLIAEPFVNSAVAQMHKLKVKDPVTGKKSKIAHGDLRPTNILVRQAHEGKLGEVRWEVKFVDFDWACYDGKNLYPGFLSGSLPWLSQSGQPIFQRHDKEFLSRTLGALRGELQELKGILASVPQKPSRRSRVNPEANAFVHRGQAASTAPQFFRYSCAPRIVSAPRPTICFRQTRFCP